ncbi:hypothetical protein [Halorubrum sp. SY-15]|jgi:hypothetical protein|uniref:hypothetical protein n=1 Tax=Halorubrum sp. SY-15 TaxID=3402277 RepID=UPI003EBF1302
MAKVSIGLRGWRFDEADIVSEDGVLKPLEEIPEEPRERLVRLVGLVDKPCDVCYLEHGEEEAHRCAEAAIVYGEPGGEVLLCDAHEPDLVYWYREAGGAAHAGEQTFGDRFHEWIAAGNEAPPGYESVEHVDEDPEGLPELPDQLEVQRRMEENFEGRRIDIRALAGDEPTETELADSLDEETLAESDVDLSTEYPTDR